MTSGLYCALFGLIVAVGLSNLQYVDMNSGTYYISRFFPHPEFICLIFAFISLSTIPNSPQSIYRRFCDFQLFKHRWTWGLHDQCREQSFRIYQCR